MPFDPSSEFIEIGDHVGNRGVGDILTLTSVVREVNQRYPDKKIVIMATGDKTCFLNNPRVYQIKDELLPRDQNAHIHGHYIKKKCAWFGIMDPSYRNELFLTDQEMKEASDLIKELSGSRPVVMFSPNSRDRRRDWTPDGWQRLVETVSSKYDVYQLDRISHNMPVWLVGTDGAPEPDPARTIAGSRQELRGIEWRKAMALMAVSGKYLGTNTGFLPMANAFGCNHFVFHDTRFVSPSEWEYPDNYNFYEHSNIEDVISGIKQNWLS